LHLSYNSNEVGAVEAELYDIKGSIVASQEFGKQNEGMVELNMDLLRVNKSGLYILKLVHGSQQLSKKIVLSF
jgi:hypothetical protein